MSFVTAALIGAGGALVGGLISSSGARQGASMQADAAANAQALQKQMYDEQVKRNEPFAQAGLTAQNRLMELLGLGGKPGAQGYGKYARDFSMQDFQADPGYGFRVAEGQKALDRQAAARGGLISGGALKAAQRYGQDMGSQEYMNAFNRYQTNRANQLNPLGSLMQSGQGAVNNQAAAAGKYGSEGAAALQAAGEANAAGAMGQANTWNRAINAGTSAYTDASMMNALMNRPSNYNYLYSQPWTVGPQFIG